jgi:hypothetical protein
MSVLFKEGAYLNLYIGNSTHMFRFWYREPVPTVLQTVVYRCGCCATKNIFYTSPAELQAAVEALLLNENFLRGEFMNWSTNQPYMEFVCAGDFLSIQ